MGKEWELAAAWRLSALKGNGVPFASSGVLVSHLRLCCPSSSSPSTQKTMAGQCNHRAPPSPHTHMQTAHPSRVCAGEPAAKGQLQGAESLPFTRVESLLPCGMTAKERAELIDRAGVPVQVSEWSAYLCERHDR